MGACYQCFKKTGDMSVLWKDCLRHNKNLSKGKKSADKKGDKYDSNERQVKARSVKIESHDFSKLLSEATAAVEGMSEEVDFSSLYFHGVDEPTYKANSVIIVDRCM